ncbi:hypothetical protein BJF89_14790 [Corynebacterium sp. CNJ-954]|uniref:hypothetical protein n=1 Tax=Corynebacterium sp. CNJ-954 TaxID=1904962 RepID=UPI00095CC2CB|nr:hypothetical protein [Corynebacterium sp. CNJ-954]OLT55747.1 hypothetical protein BJF89_14790 [Corynebacterium sp. CNJ-954]
MSTDHIALRGALRDRHNLTTDAAGDLLDTLIDHTRDNGEAVDLHNITTEQAEFLLYSAAEHAALTDHRTEGAPQ